MTEAAGRSGRWWAFWITLFIALWGVHLIVTSLHSWLWFIPMFLPFMAVLQLESEKTAPLGYKAPASDGQSRVIRTLGFWSAGLVAFIGIVVMTETSAAWFWFSPLLIPFLVLLPGRMREWELQDEAKKRRKEERQLEGRSIRVRKILKWVFWVAAIGLIWYIGSYYLLVLILG